MPKATKPATLDQIMQEHERLHRDHEDTESAIADAVAALPEIDQELSAAHSKIALRESMPEHDERRSQRVKEAKAELSAIAARYAALESTLAERRAHKKAILNELDQLQGGTVQEVLTLQNEADASQATVDRLAQLIADKEPLATPLGIASDLDDERSRVLASVELGEASPADLERIEKLLETAAKEAAQKAAEAARSAALVNGLRARLNAAERENEAAQHRFRIGFGLLLRQRRQDAAAGYAETVRALFNAFGELTATTAMLGSIGQEDATARSLWDSRALEVRPAHASHDDIMRDDGDFRDAAMQDLKLEWVAHGLRLPQ